MSMENDGDADNIELNKAIADSISSLDSQQNDNEKGDGEGDDQEDIDLENAIGDVFNQFDFGNTDAKTDGDADEPHDEEHKNDEHFELDEAIDNALGSIDVNKQHTNKQQSQSATETSAGVQVSESDDKTSNNQKDDELEEAIGNAISSLDGKPEGRNEADSLDEVVNDKKEAEDDSHQQETHNDSEDQGPIDDDALEKAIRDAFGDNQPTQNQEATGLETHKGHESRALSEPTAATYADKRILEEESEKLDEVIDGAFNALGNSDQRNQYGKVNDEPEPVNDQQSNRNVEYLNSAIASAFNDISGNNNDHAAMENSGTDDNDDLDLNEAIGNAFKNISELTGNNGEPKLESQAKENVEKNENGHDTIRKPGEVQHKHKEPHNDKFSRTINNVLKEFIPSNNENNGTQDDDLNEVISASFKQLMENDNTGKKVGETHNAKNSKELSEAQHSNKDGKPENMDIFMENVISEAFRNVAEQTKLAQDATSKEDESEKQGETGVDLTNLVQNMVHQMSHFEDNAKPNQGSLPISEDILQELALEITNQVQDQIEDESHKKSKTITDMPQIDENVLAHFQNEAYKDDKYNENDKLDTGKAPDDNSLQAALATAVRNAIESNATTLNDQSRKLSISQGAKQDNETDDFEQLQMNDILQNAFNMAMENPHDLLTNLEMDEENDEHRQDKSETHLAATRSQSSHVANALARLPHPLPASTATFLESLNRSNDIDLSGPSTNRKKKSRNHSSNTPTTSESITSHTDHISAVAKNIMSNFANKSLTLNNKDEAKKTSLSIAETLALHRSSMNGAPKRDYSSIESLEGALKNEQGSSSNSSQINSQVSDVLSSLTSRINSSAGTSGADNNLLQVIRQMTSTLTSKPSTSSSSYLLPTSTPSVSDIISSYKDKRDENAIINPLILAKKFLEEKQMTPSNGKAVSLIDNVLELFNSNRANESHIDPSIRDGPFVSPQLNLENFKPEFIFSISNSVASAISNFSSRSKRGSFFGERFKTDSPEYKERIRLDNRERKKRWREENAERNKDNDLRSRVLKRATLMFGEKDIPEKKSWVDDEFNKRREKRIAKQKKDDYERQSKSFEDDSLDRKSFREKEPNTLVHDPNLIKPVTDIFNIVSNATHNEDPDAVLSATSAATATAAAMYASTNNTTNFKLIESAVSKIILSLMENSHSASQEERIASLSKGVTSTFKLEASPTTTSAANKQMLPSKLPDSELTSLVKTTSNSTSGILNRLSASIRGFSPSLSALPNVGNVSSSLLQLQNLTLNNNQEDNSQKRKSDESLPHEAKRSKPSSPLSEPKSVIENSGISESTSIANIASNLDTTRNSVAASSNNSHLWSSSNALKMPHYKKPDVFSAVSINSNTDECNIDPAIKREYPTLSLASTSPFISNKANYLSGNRSLANSSISQTTSGLKKPGSFQRPSYSKPEKNKNQNVLGYPLHSTSLRES